MKKILAFLCCAAVLASCSRSGKPAAGPAGPSPAPTLQPAAAQQEGAEASAPGLSYFPSRARVLMKSDAEPVLTEWQSLGLALPAARNEVLYGLLASETALTGDPEGASETARLDPLSRLQVTDAGEWTKSEAGFSRRYRVKAQAAGQDLEGYVDSSSVALVTAESGGIAAGFVERKIAISGGESSYNVLAVAELGAVELLEAGALVFADSFLPTGITLASVTDVNADGALEVVIEADTIVSLHYLGATPLHWEAWLRKKPAGWAPILQYNARFATDEGDSYTSSRRAFDASGAGFLDTVKVTIRHELVTEDKEFANTIQSFYVWDGKGYRKDGAQELPKQGTVTAEEATLRADGGVESAAGETLRKGDLLYVDDRSDAKERVGETVGFWYRAVTKSGAEGWVHAGELALSWIDPLKINREVFRGAP